MYPGEDNPDEIKDYLQELGSRDPAFGAPDSGELATDDHETTLRRSLLALAQSAHDQIFGQGKQAEHDPTDDKIGTVIGEAFVHDAETNTAYHISTYDYGGERGMMTEIKSATPYTKDVQAAEFQPFHDLYLTYDGKVVEDTDSSFLLSTAFRENDGAKAFMAMAESVARSTAIKPRQFRRAESKARSEYLTGHVGRFAILKDILGFKPERDELIS